MIEVVRQLRHGINPLSGRRLHPFVRLAVYLNSFMAAIGVVKLLSGFFLSKEQRGWLSLVLDLLLSAAGIALALRVRHRALSKYEKRQARLSCPIPQEGDTQGYPIDDR